jgi:hypothetical protein
MKKHLTFKERLVAERDKLLKEYNEMGPVMQHLEQLKGEITTKTARDTKARAIIDNKSTRRTTVMELLELIHLMLTQTGAQRELLGYRTIKARQILNLQNHAEWPKRTKKVVFRMKGPL